MRQTPKISFGMIVLNGEPFIHYNLMSLYPFAHEIIIVEGAVIGAKAVATSNGHSKDSTLETIKAFQANHDPDNKVILISRDAFWEEKDEMSQAYAERATGNYLWQVDSDEFYRAQDMQTIVQLLNDDPSITGMSFKMKTFWGNIDTITDGRYLQRGADIFHRLFKWGDGYTYLTHRPPTVINEQGINCYDINWINGNILAKQGIIMYHYSLLFPKQVHDKNTYYQSAGWSKNQRQKALDWTDTVYMQLQNPLRVHNVYQYPSWLERFNGNHPEQILKMWQDIDDGKLTIEKRHHDDIDRLLSSPTYWVKRNIVKYMNKPDLLYKKVRYEIVLPIVQKLIPKRIRTLLKNLIVKT